jgi:hypothetical protein
MGFPGSAEAQWVAHRHAGMIGVLRHVLPRRWGVGDARHAEFAALIVWAMPIMEGSETTKIKWFE